MKPVICVNGQVRPADDGATIDPKYLGLHNAIRPGAGVKVTYAADGSVTIDSVCCDGPSSGGSPGAEVRISTDADNRLVLGSDGGLYVRDDLDPNPLAFYILAKN